MVPSILKKRSNKGTFVTELKAGETLSVNGVATFKLIEACHQNNKDRSLVSVVAEKDVKIFKNYGGTFK